MSGRRPLVILGSGYTGKWIYTSAVRQAQPILASSRRPDRHLGYVAPPARLRFDLADPTTWCAVPPDADLIWTFPAVPLEQVRAFAGQWGRFPRKVVVLGSTSAYDTAGDMAVDPPPWLDETTPIDHALPRVQGEEYLRLHHGAVILRVAGIYGPHRNPVDWIRQGRVGPTDKFVNLIHVEDLAEICLRAVQTGRGGESYNVSDGRPRRWSGICEEVALRWGIVGTQGTKPQGPGKRLLNQKFLAHFDYTLRYPDLYEALQTMQMAPLPLR